MPIILKLEIKIDVTKVYFLDSTNKEFLNQEFNKLHDQDCIQFTT